MRGPPPPKKKSQNYRVSKQYWSGTPENKQSFHARIQCRAIIVPPAKRWRGDDDPLLMVFGSSLTSLTKKQTKQNKKQLAELQSWTPSDQIFWIRAYARAFTARTHKAGRNEDIYSAYENLALIAVCSKRTLRRACPSAHSPELSMLVYIKYGNRKSVKLYFRSLSPLDCFTAPRTCMRSV